MSEAVLTVLKFCFLALLYLFLYRVVRLTLRELRAPALTAEPAGVPTAAPPPRRERRPEPRAGLRLRILEPASRQGETHTIDREVTVGRGGGCGSCSTTTRTSPSCTPGSSSRTARATSRTSARRTAPT